jgi:serine protease AprX
MARKGPPPEDRAGAKPAEPAPAGSSEPSASAEPAAGSATTGASHSDVESPAGEIDPRRSLRSSLRSSVISDAFNRVDRKRGPRLGLPLKKDETVSMMIELNLQFDTGLAGAKQKLLGLCEAMRLEPKRVSDTYYQCRMNLLQAKDLVRRDQADEAKSDAHKRAIYRIWPDFKISRLIDSSVATVKADAARRAFAASGFGITWAVVDSGIDRTHPHFLTYDTLDTLGGDVALLHRDFTQPDLDSNLHDDQRTTALLKLRDDALTDSLGHGTHVAGIIAGAAVPLAPVPGTPDPPVVVVAQRADTGDQLAGLELRKIEEPSRLAGVAPRAKLVSLKVMGGAAGDSGDTSTNVLRALRYIRQEVNGDGKIQRIHGVNLSVGYEFDARWFACGQSPICVEVDRLVRSGVVVVVAAGNTGYGDLTSKEGFTSAGLTLTINDPGNAELAITVGATHRDMPHMYGVSFFSSKGPTGDGRQKPDVVAPGERITSCAAGPHLQEMKAAGLLDNLPPGQKAAAYIDDNGTSMAAPHVSGAAAAFLSIRREFIGRPEEVKRIFLATATSLGRVRYFEGQGLVDLMRAIQSV